MIFTKIQATNVFSFEELTFEFTSGIHNILGVNGSGKTSLFLILSLGLYNRTPKGNKVNDADNIVTGKPWEIEIFAVKDNGDKLRVLNSRVTGDIKIWKNGKSIGSNTIPRNLKIIEQEFGQYESFVTRCYQSSESTIDLIEDSKDSARKEFCERVLRFDEIDRIDVKLEARRKELVGKNGRIELAKKTIQTLRSAVGEIEAISEELPLDELQSRVSELEVQLQAQTSSLAVTESKLAEVNEWHKLSLTNQAARDRLLIIEKEINEIALVSTAEFLSRDLQYIRQEISKYESEIATKKTEISKFKAAESQGKCDRCGTGIEPGFYEQLILKAEAVVNAQQLLLRSAKGTESELELHLAAHQRVAQLVQEQLKLQARPEAQFDLNVLVAEQNQLNELKCIANETVSRLSFDLQLVKVELRDQTAFNQRQRTLRELNKRVEEKNAEIKGKLAESELQLELSEELADLLKLARELIAGYKTVRMQRFLKQLNQQMLKYTRMLCGGQIKSRFFVDTEGKIQFSVIDPHKQLPWNNWSKGQQARVKLSVLFGMIEQLETMGTESYNVLFLDEIFGSLDAAGREGLSNVLVYLKQQGKSVFTIAHTPIIHQVLYDKVIEMKFENGISSIGG
jgi:DNA repair exonuclease SbcCD ATPase subunit